MTFNVIFVDLVVVVRQIVSRKTRKCPNPSNERSERMSTQMTETVKNVRVLVSFYAAREDGNVSNELVHKGKIFDLNEFKSHVISFTDIKTVAVQKRIGQSIDINIVCASKKKSLRWHRCLLNLRATNGRKLEDSQISKVHTSSREIVYNSRIISVTCLDTFF